MMNRQARSSPVITKRRQLHDREDRACTHLRALNPADRTGQSGHHFHYAGALVLLDRLKADPEAPWNDYGPNGLTAMKLGALLREYDIRSDTIRFPGTGKQAKGYHRADFLDAWARYCPAHEPPATPVRDATVLTLPGTAVPAVPASKPQVTAGTASNPGTA